MWSPLEDIPFRKGQALAWQYERNARHSRTPESDVVKA